MVDGNQDGRQPAAPPEPVAVVGLGCRLPGGADSPEGLWTLLSGGGTATGTVPEERWRGYGDLGADHAAAVRGATRWGSFLPDVEGFDAEFFGLSPREAELMDPQQRILLEVAWEALEHAGILPRDLAGDDVGVFVGIGSDDYGRRMLEDLPRIDAWTGIGAAMCAASNRISHALDLRGPSMSVDTACSSSLVATHLACQSLRLGESTLALAAGVNLIVSPGLTLTLDAAGAMAPDGRSKSFDASADGYGRGEGCGVLVLKRLSDARRDGDRVLAVIRGSAINQDGRTNGIMAPSGPAQRHLLERACRQAGVAPASVDYVEAHGTGTRLGDPLEVSALGAVFGADRAPDAPCLIGSVKSNIGHLEAGAGAASLIKAVLALRHREIPPSVNFTSANPAIDWAGSGLRVVTERTAWPHSEGPRRAGVSGFGYGGTIAHVLLEEAPEEAGDEDAAAEADGPRLFPLSAGSEAGLREQAGKLADWLAGPGEKVPLSSVGHTLARRRTHLAHRAAVTAADRAELAKSLRGLAADDTPPTAVTGSAPGERGGGLVWVFSGHGSHWAGMGRELLASEPVFAAVLDDLEPVFLEEIGFSPRQVLDEGDLGPVDRAQTMIFAMQLGLAELWRSYGVVPDAVIGHSVGEIAAAVVTGALSRHDGARLICRRSKLLRRVAGQGAMVMAALPFDEVRDRLAGRDGLVAAISSSPASTVVAGDRAGIEALLAQWRDEGVVMRKVTSDVAFHSPQMDPLLAELTAAAEDLRPGRPRVRMYSTALEDPDGITVPDGSYWAANLRNPVRLSAAVEAAARDGHRAFLEISAHPVVAHSIGETLAELGHQDAFVGSSLRRNLPERATLLLNVGAAHCHGVVPDWSSLHPGGGLADLPTVAWRHRPYWYETSMSGRGAGLGHDADAHALLGPPVPVAGRSLRLWRTLLDEESRPYPGSHSINGVEIVPAAVLINSLMSAAAGDSGGAALPVLADVDLQLPLPVTGRREVQVVREDAAVRIASRTLDDTEDGAEGSWLTHTTCSVAGDARPHADLGALPTTPPGEPVDTEAVTAHLAAVGVPSMAFSWTVEELRRGDGALRARVRADQPENAPPTWAPVLDAALSAAPFAFPGDAVLRMVAHVAEVTLTGPPLDTALVEVIVDDGTGNGTGNGTGGGPTDNAEVLIADTDGRVVARLTGLGFAVMDRDRVSSAGPRSLLHEMAWRPIELPAVQDGGERPGVVIVAADAGAAEPLRAGLAAAGADVEIVDRPEALADRAAPDAVLVPAPPPSGGGVAEDALRAAWLLTTTAQTLAELDANHPPRLWSLTTGAAESLDESGLAHSPLWGLGRVLAGERPELWGGTVDLDPADPGAAAAAVAALLPTAPRQEVIKVRAGEVSIARLVRPEGAPDGQRLECRADGTYLITGGLGVLGLEVARKLAERGARRLVLAGRRPFPARASWDDLTDPDVRRQVEAVRALEAAGVTVRVVSLDIADAAQAADRLDPDALGLPPIRGVVHAAGVLDDRLLPNVDEESLRRVMRPKVEGAWVLHTLFPPGSLDFLVLFSSCGQLLGLPGQAAYGSANAFLDGLAAHRNADGNADTFSLGWTSWRGKGMAVNEVVDLELAARGVGDISAEEAFGAWDLALRHGPGYYPVLRTLPLGPGAELPAVLAEVPAEEPADAPSPAGDPGRFAELPPERLQELLLEEVGGQIATEMRLAADDLDPRRSLTEQGLDSVMTLVIRRRLEKRFGQSLPSTLLWHQPTVTAIAEHLAGLLADAVPASTEPERTKA
ncbi:type I polyketide synthase [Spirillospora sp. NBC_00431]